MRLFRSFKSAETVEGEWFVFRQEGEGDKAQALRVKLKPIPAGEERRIESKHFGKARSVVYTEQGKKQDINVESQIAYHAERALHALVDTENASFSVEDEAMAAKWTEALGFPVKAGEEVTLDGHWSRPVAELAFSEAPPFAIWISAKAGELRILEANDEAGKGKP